VWGILIMTKIRRAISPKEVVQRKYPQSYCVRNKKTGLYVIYSRPEGTARIIAGASSPALAWKRARDYL